MDLFTFIQLLIVSITATTTMTLFSYAVSKTFREVFKEPVLLSYILVKLKTHRPLQSETTWGWLLHYIIGFLFVLAYHYIWVRDILPVSFLSALLLGASSGIIGVISWIIIFQIANHRPNIDFKGYYLQLFFAHIIFALTATAIYFLSLTILIVVKAYVIV
jgi:hypothetical protein